MSLPKYVVGVYTTTTTTTTTNHYNYNKCTILDIWNEIYGSEYLFKGIKVWGLPYYAL